jgi:hypothetical protein
MFSFIGLIVVAIPSVFGAYLAFAPKTTLRKEAAWFPVKWIIGALDPYSKKERLVLRFWRFCGYVILLVVASMVLVWCALSK